MTLYKHYHKEINLFYINNKPMHNIFQAICCVMEKTTDIKALYIIHINLFVRKFTEELR